jgi:hypothetical protein
MRYAQFGAWADGCMKELDVCERKGQILEGYDVDIMGFLLSCRHAYTEGIDVLYSTNCISIQSEPLLLHLPQLIPHNRLASITSLEMVIKAHRIEQDNDRPSFELGHMKLVLDNIVTHCHHLRSLRLSFVVHSYGHEILDGQRCPGSMRSGGPCNLRNMRIELPTRDYFPAWDAELQPMVDHPCEAPTKGPFDRSLWRSLYSKEPRVQFRAIERYPYPPFKLPVLEKGDESVESAGYWLCQGDEGLMTQFLNGF